MLSITLDWIAFTFREDTHEAAEWLSIYTSPKSAVETAPANGYRTAYRSQQGVVSMWNVDRPEMGYHVIISGSALRDFIEHFHMDQKGIVEKILNAGGSITRLDIAVDLTGEKCSLDKIYQAMERKESVGTARTFVQMHSINGGNTIYVGSRKSEKFIRIYDKASQMDAQDMLWFRFELETTGMVARSCARSLVGPSDWYATWQTIVLHMVDLPHQVDYRKFFKAGLVETGIPKLEKKSDREAWIKSQCIPAIVKHYVEHRNSEAIKLLRQMLDQIDNPAYNHDNEL